MFKYFSILVGPKIAVLFAGLGVGKHHPVNELLKTPFALLGTNRPAEVLGGDNG